MKNQQIPNSFDLTKEVRPRLVTIRGQLSLLDRDVAALYGVETKALNQAVKRNANRFPDGYVFQLTDAEFANWKSQIVTSNRSREEMSAIKMGLRRAPYAFTEKGLYMLATVLRSEQAVRMTLAIVETYAQVRELKRELVDLHRNPDPSCNGEKIRHFGEILSDIVMPDPDVVETESSLELNFFVGKIKHTVKRIKKSGEAGHSV